jgi:hypothetical protein
MDNYITIKIYTDGIKRDDPTLYQLFSSYPKEDIQFELIDEGIVIYLRELDFLTLRKHQSLA